jgi:hypothetical protein
MSGISAIDVEQPPSASADSSSASAANAHIFRSTDIRPEVIRPEVPTSLVRALQYKSCNHENFNPSNLAAAFKPLSPETIKAETTKRTGEASICQNQDALPQCSTSNRNINREPAIVPSSSVTNWKRTYSVAA